MCILHFVSVLLTVLISAILSNISYIKLSSLLSWYPASSSVEKWRLLRFAEVSPFCNARCFLADCPGKNDFWVGKIIFLELDSGDCWIPVFFCVYSCLAGKKMIFGSGKSFFWNWTVVIAGFLSFSVSTAAWQAKKWFLGRENHFFLELDSGDCWIPFFFCVYSCLAGCHGKNDFWVGKIIFLELNSGDCWIPLFFCVYSCLAGCPGKKIWFLGRENHFLALWRVVTAGVSPGFAATSLFVAGRNTTSTMG